MKNGEWQKQWRQKPENQVKERLRSRQRYRDDQKVKARKIAQQDKTVLNEPCFFCGRTENIQRHHFDYNKEKEVIPLCEGCHIKYHKLRNREKKNNNTELAQAE